MSDITYTRVVNELKSSPEAGEQIVVYVLWTLFGKKGALTSQIQTNTPIVFDPNTPLVPYDQLTPEIVFSWVDNALSPEEKAAGERIIADGISRQETPPLVVLPPPWNV